MMRIRYPLPAILLALTRGSTLPGANEQTPTTAPSTAPARPVVVVENDFQRRSGSEWENLPLAWAPDQQERFLGEFDTNSNVALRVSVLPPHAWLRIVFDLYVLKSWDGNTGNDPFGNVIGPDVWKLWVQDGPTLIHTSFALFTRDGGRQSFPDDHPGGDYADGTGAAATNTLGTEFQGQQMNAIYHFDLTVPHTAGSVRLNFRSAGPAQGVGDESWGLDNFRLEAWPSPPGKDAEAATLDELARDLAGTDPVRAFNATWGLISTGDRAISPLREVLRPRPIDEEQVRRLIGRLDHPAYKVRQAAAEELMEAGPPIERSLRRALAGPLSVETRVQIATILSAMNKQSPGNRLTLRYMRAVRVLEILGSPAAAEALKDLADQAPTASARQAAVAALARVEEQERIKQ